jgi:hypothetical protein
MVLALPMVPWAQMRVEASRAGRPEEAQRLYFRSGPVVRRLAAGFEHLMADIYWLRTVQYYGHQIAFVREPRFDLLLPLVDITVTLDPRFQMAYRYGATFLAEPYPRGAGQPDAAVGLLERAIRANPGSWRLGQDLAAIHYFYRRDPDAAAAVLKAASRVPGAPYWLETLAAEFLYRGGERETSRRMWQRIHETAEEGHLKENALFHLRHLDALDVAERLEAVVQRFAATHGRRPATLDELRSEGLVSGPLVDGSGTPFAYDPATGHVTIDRASALWRPR